MNLKCIFYFKYFHNKLRLMLPWTISSISRKTEPASFRAMQRYVALSSTWTEVNWREPVRCIAYPGPVVGIATPSFSQVTSGLGKPSVSHDSIARLSTVAATSEGPSSIVGGTADRNSNLMLQDNYILNRIIIPWNIWCAKAKKLTLILFHKHVHMHSWLHVYYTSFSSEFQ